MYMYHEMRSTQPNCLREGETCYTPMLTRPLCPYKHPRITSFPPLRPTTVLTATPFQSDNQALVCPPRNPTHCAGIEGIYCHTGHLRESWYISLRRHLHLQSEYDSSNKQPASTTSTASARSLSLSLSLLHRCRRELTKSQRDQIRNLP